MAKLEEFLEKLKSMPEEFTYHEMELDGKPGYLVEHMIHGTKTHFTYEAIENYGLSELIDATYQGKSLEHMTRVTGFFSKTESWNKGKLGELKERKREKNFGI